MTNLAALIVKGLLAQSEGQSLEGCCVEPKRYSPSATFDQYVRASRADVEAGRVTLMNWHGEIEVQRLAKYIARQLAKTGN